MWSIKVLLGALAFANAASKPAMFGPAYQLRSTTSYILEAETTLIPPDLPVPQQNTLLLWAGTVTDTKDRFQSVLASYDSKRSICGARVGQWCAYGRKYSETGRAAPMSPAEAAVGVTIRFLYNQTSGRTLQTLATQQRILAIYETASGKPKGWETAVECQEQCGGITVYPHTYKNTTIKLARADPSFGSNSALKSIAKSSPLITFDGGKTWSIDTIDLQKAVFPG